MTFPFVSGSFPAVLQWVIHNSYPLIFIGMVIEGPILTSTAAFAVSLGYLNLFIIFILAMLGDIVGDFIWYGVGYFSRIAVVDRFGHRFDLSQERMESLRRFLEKHPVKTLAVIKASPFLPVPGLIVAGSSHMSVKKFAAVISLIILPKTIFFMTIGYFFGRAYDTISSYINGGVYALVIITLIILAIYYGFREISAKVSKRLEKELESEDKKVTG